ncbi:hypothetical protein GDO81_011633, partial [Engystomops pustulosus]
SLYSLNYEPLLKSINADLAKWKGLGLSWFGRMNVLKMDILPRLLYLFQTVPMDIPRAFFTTLHKAARQFIWRDTAPRIRRSLLTRPKRLGGAGLPDFTTYHRAAIGACILDLFHHKEDKIWVRSELDLSSPH